ncbi:MAG TPA: CHASE3 domain-containing protein, partial [Pirellulales bacterium]
MTARPSRKSSVPGTGFGLLLALAAVLLLFIGSGAATYLNIRTLSESAGWVAHTHEVLINTADVMSQMRAAESNQRAYIITGDERYRTPYETAVALVWKRIEAVEKLTRDNESQQPRIEALRNEVKARLDILKQTIDVRDAEGIDAARDRVATNRGKEAMDAIAERIEEMSEAERALRVQRLEATADAYSVAVSGVLLTGVVGVILSLAVASLIQRAAATRQRQEWLQTGQLGLSAATAGDLRLERLGENTLKYLAEYLDAQAGAFYASDEGQFIRVATYGVPAAGGAPERFTLADGLLGQAAKDARTIVVRDVPDGYLSFGSALGQGKPRNLLIVPVSDDGVVNAVLELGFVNAIDEAALRLFEKAAEAIGVSVQAANYRVRLQNFLEETQRQAEELQAQTEELRVSNEELEEQGRALRESQARLEQQQAELEQTNVQLEEQTLILEAQRDDVSRAKTALQTQAQELEQASRYKSDFLANMSHELRTPLNSSLILAKLLADNAQGNLTAEQVKYAETIQSSGNDLLALINDILDLSKIEAGHMEVRPQSARLTQIVEDIARTFRPIAGQKNLAFRTEITPGTPDVLDTDRQRLEQVLKNLLSNAMKFTERGEVTLRVSAADAGRIAFAVSDTGIGIPVNQQQVVFEAFRQADGTINRKYGGTGLGLSISRELARLLG